MMNVDAARVGSRQIADRFLKRWRQCERIGCQHIEQGLRLFLQAGGGQFFRVLLGLLAIHQLPAHQPGSFALSSSGSAIAARIESRIPGTETRWRVSWIASQSSADTSTALLRLPVMVTGVWLAAVSSIKL